MKRYCIFFFAIVAMFVSFFSCKMLSPPQTWEAVVELEVDGTPSDDLVKNVVNTLSNRLKKAGIHGAEVKALRGEGTKTCISVLLPDVEDKDCVRKLIQSPAKLLCCSTSKLVNNL